MYKRFKRTLIYYNISIDNTIFGSYFRTLAVIHHFMFQVFVAYMMIVYRFDKMCTSVIL